MLYTLICDMESAGAMALRYDNIINANVTKNVFPDTSLLAKMS